jgi:hypothetical protein
MIERRGFFFRQYEEDTRPAFLTHLTTTMPSSRRRRKLDFQQLDFWRSAVSMSPMNVLSALLLGIAGIGAAHMAQSPRLAPVRVAEGQLSGATAADPGVTVFKGVPFAAPPVGDRRWRAPQPAAPWQGVRKADAFSPNCVQNIVDVRKPWTYEFMAHGAIGEDCLYLNVWTPARASERTPSRPGLHPRRRQYRRIGLGPRLRRHGSRHEGASWS